MATKNNPGAFDCYANAESDEPMFVLLARDKHAPTLVWLWAALREIDGEDAAKVDEARNCMMSMLLWQAENGRKTIGVGQAALAAVMELVRAANFANNPVHGTATEIEQVRAFMCKTEFAREEDAAHD